MQPVVLDIIDRAFQFSSSNPKGNNLNSGYSSNEQYANKLQKDCFLVFRSLCKLSNKPLPEGYPDPKSHELRSKILSLHLLLGILQNGKEAFCNTDIFVSAIKVNKHNHTKILAGFLMYVPGSSDHIFQMFINYFCISVLFVGFVDSKWCIEYNWSFWTLLGTLHWIAN